MGPSVNRKRLSWNIPQFEREFPVLDDLSSDEEMSTMNGFLVQEGVEGGRTEVGTVIERDLTNATRLRRKERKQKRSQRVYLEPFRAINRRGMTVSSPSGALTTSSGP